MTLLQAGNQQTKIRLNQIDAPELGQAFGQSSKQSLSELAFGKEIRIEVDDTDKYGRTVGTVWVGDMDANLDQINREHGRGTLRYGSEAASNGWRMRQRLKSPAYTTRWKELPSATAC